jgi:hypothetical protein
MRSRADLKSIQAYSSLHRHLFAESDFAVCFYCRSRFAPSEVQDWIDGKQVETGETDDGLTALCPRCGIDAVLPSAAPIRFDDALLEEMHAYWFGKRAPAL